MSSFKKIFTAVFYKNPLNGKEPFKDWLSGLNDKRAQAKILVCIERAESGNFGDHKSIGDGIFEMRIFYGPGYRLYYALENNKIILLLVGGDKSTQRRDIEKAKRIWASRKES